MRHIKRWYWAWRFSPISRLYYAIKTFIYIQWNAKKIALVLDDCVRAMGQMNHPSSYKGTCKKCGEKQMIESPDKDCMTMKVLVRSDLINTACWHTLPCNWKWR